MASQYSADLLQVKLECLADYGCEIGENPLWHPIERRIYWTDIPGGRLFRYDAATGHHEQCYAGRPVGGFTIQADGALLLFLDRGTIVNWREGVLTEVVHEVPGELDSRFNDVIADPEGRVFCGTMFTPDRKGRLYRLDLDGSLRLLLEGIGCPNGMAFTHDRKRLYFTDSFAREIYLFDYDIEDGSIANQRVFARFQPSDGFPDGSTLDGEGRLWTAMWDGGCIVRLSADGQIEEILHIPAPKVSSLIFGGDDYRDLYITTAGGNAKITEGPQAGALFRLKAAGQGVSEFFSRISVSAATAINSAAPNAHITTEKV
jgi:sugar lactone lactonase YvrE